MMKAATERKVPSKVKLSETQVAKNGINESNPVTKKPHPRQKVHGVKHQRRIRRKKLLNLRVLVRGVKTEVFHQTLRKKDQKKEKQELRWV